MAENNQEQNSKSQDSKEQEEKKKHGLSEEPQKDTRKEEGE